MRSNSLAPGPNDLGAEHPSDHDVGDVELSATPSGSVKLDSGHHGSGRPAAIELDLSKVPKLSIINVLTCVIGQSVWASMDRVRAGNYFSAGLFQA